MLDKILPVLGRKAQPWTETAALPGGDIPGADFEGFLRQFRETYPWLPAALAWRLARNYGTRTTQLLGRARNLRDLGEEIGDGLYEAEVEYLRAREWAVTAEDILWRRSKLGLHVSARTAARLEAWMENHTRTNAA